MDELTDEDYAPLPGGDAPEDGGIDWQRDDPPRGMNEEAAR